jgi:predicted AAA+ superfamily ATPase
LADFLHQSPLEKLAPFHEKLIRLLKEYLYVGGMPEAVETYAANKKDFVSARKVQNAILDAYNRDFSKYATSLFSERLRMLWASVPIQLSKENKKFTYADIKKGARGKDFDVAIQWLKDSALIAGVNRVTTPLHPLKSYEDISSYKVFLNDIGLLSAMVDLETKMLVTQNDLFVEFKGALAEQYVFQELRCAIGKTLYYWSKEKTNIEIDFLIQNTDGKAVAIEVKSGINLRAKSLKAYIDKYQPDYSICTSLANYKVDETNRIIDVPLYAAGRIGELL